MTKDQFIRSLNPPKDDPCSICYEKFAGHESHAPVRLACGHWFGLSCLLETIEISPSPQTCPNCRDKMYRVEGEVDNTVEVDIPTLTMRPREAWEEICRKDDEWCVRFVQLLWKCVHPYAVEGVLAYDRVPMREQLQRMYPSILRNLLHAPPYTDPSWDIVRASVMPRGASESPALFQFNFIAMRMSRSPAMFMTDNLPDESAHLWWQVIKGELFVRPMQNITEFTLLHFVLMQHSMNLAASPAAFKEPSHWTLRALADQVGQVIDYSGLGQDTLTYKMSSNPSEMRAIFAEVRRLQEASDTPNQPIFTGKQEEQQEVLRVYQIMSHSPENYPLFRQLADSV